MRGEERRGGGGGGEQNQRRRKKMSIAGLFRRYTYMYVAMYVVR